MTQPNPANQPLPIGRVKGPGDTPHTFTFLAPDPEQRLTWGEFITYTAEVDGQSRILYARISEREPKQLYPDDFSGNPDLSPEEIALALGYEDTDYPLLEFTAAIIGYYETNLRDFINPRIDPTSGSPVYLASNAQLTAVLNRCKPEFPGSLHIGSLLTRPQNAVPIILDGKAITNTHLAIIASTGAGKSYLTGVILEELLRPYNKAAVLVIDPHSEYHTLSELSDQPAFRNGRYRPQIKVFQPGQVKIAPSTLFIADLVYLLPDLSEKMRYLLERAYYAVRGRHRQWTVLQLIEQVRQMGGKDTDRESSLKGYGPTAEALAWRLESVLGRTGVFDDAAHLPLLRFYRPGQATILQLNEMSEREQQVLVSTLLRRLLWARTQTIQATTGPPKGGFLPYPVFVVIEEAHRFAPATADVVSSGILKEVLAEGRKFGVGLALISQRPGKLDSDVISQCNTHCLLRIVNDLDQRKVAESVETVGKTLLTELPALTKGQVIVAGEGISTPVLCQVRERYTPHGGTSPDAFAEWDKA